MARAHGGGTWVVVKTPMRNKSRKRRSRNRDEAPDEILAKAIARSSKAAQRKEAKAQKKALKAAELEMDFDTIEEQDAVLSEPQRGRFRRNPKIVSEPSPRGQRRFLFFRGRRVQPDGIEAATPFDPAMDAPDAGPEPRKARRSLLGRKRKPTEPTAAPSLAQEVAEVAATTSKRTVRRRRRDADDAGSEASPSPS
ncbi:hypothetical protein FHS31_000712 [Sphingomonas vulcanisoli]|uniref:Uncharacterized protein n=1 Tax=Sphingomonas vulcanisoli TaxID=1658060 RepID=A0ABX0TRG8_9SPHN|nr:hypothetical protein [Sphingomonas vulcanisoli]NIJ07130.1 hypothetical protein [Sphingomonas vulcanisoli]